MFAKQFVGNFINKNVKFVRYKHKDNHWSVQRKKRSSCQKALEHFDDFYKHVFTKEWGSMRNGLLGKRKCVAVINNYADSIETKTNLENNGALNMRVLFNLEKEYIQEDIKKNKRQKELNKIWKMDQLMEHKLEAAEKVSDIDCVLPDKKQEFSLESSLQTAEYDTSRIVDSNNALSASILYEFVPATKIKGMEDFVHESSHYQYYENSEFPLKIKKEYDFHFPLHLDVYTYEKSNHSDFESPKKGTTGVLNYYLMDGGSVLPILALDVKPGQKVLDLCAAPGGKSFLALQTLYPSYLCSNDVTNSRIDRIYKVYKQYLYNLDEKWIKANKIRVTNLDGRLFHEDNFDRVIVDVPCTTDRHSLKENENNIFRSDRIKERLKLPELQCQLLEQAMKLVKVGGVVVYSTCSLSPIQNDGVVHMTLKKLYEESQIEVVVKDLSPALVQARSFYKLADQELLKYGHLVVPYVPLNFGPTYFCKLERIR